jgi:hypothetical protein
MDSATLEALRLVASLIAPFELGRDLTAAHASCSGRYGIWSTGTARCRVPGGREYQFGLAGGLVQTITLSLIGGGPGTLFAAPMLGKLQQLSMSGRGPWLLAVSPRQLTVRPRTHPPGL